MQLTNAFSRVAAEPPDYSKYEAVYGGPSKEHQIWTENNMPVSVDYNGERYYWTGKIGNNEKVQSIVFEYSDYGEDMENRIWVTPKPHRVIPD